MREFLLELYLKHGERGFRYTDLNISGDRDKIAAFKQSKNRGYIGLGFTTPYTLTPKAIEYVKNLDNP